MLRIDDIHAYWRDYIESYVEALDFLGAFCIFGGKKHLSFNIAPFPNLMDLKARLFRTFEKSLLF